MGFLTAVLYVLDANGNRVDPASADGTRKPVAIKLGTGITVASVTENGGINEVELEAVVPEVVYIAGLGLIESPDGTFNVMPHADGSISVGEDGTRVGVLASDAQHGVRGGGTQHALAVAGVSHGFLDKDDLTKLNSMTAGAAVAEVTATSPITSSGGTSPDIAALCGTAATADYLVQRNASGAIENSSGDTNEENLVVGLLLGNEGVAELGVQNWSLAQQWTAAGWDVGAAASAYHHAYAQLRTVQGAEAATAELHFLTQKAAGAVTSRLIVRSTGVVEVPTGGYAVAPHYDGAGTVAGSGLLRGGKAAVLVAGMNNAETQQLDALAVDSGDRVIVGEATDAAGVDLSVKTGGTVIHKENGSAVWTLSVPVATYSKMIAPSNVVFAQSGDFYHDNTLASPTWHYRTGGGLTETLTVALPPTGACSMTFGLGATSVGFAHAAKTSDVVPGDMTDQTQAPYASATGANRKPGNLLHQLNTPTNSGTTYAKRSAKWGTKYRQDDEHGHRSSTGATPDIIGAITLAANEVVSGFAIITAEITATGESAAYILAFAAKQVGGTAALIGATADVLPAREDAALATASVQLGVSGATVYAESTGVAATNIEWSVFWIDGVMGL